MKKLLLLIFLSLALPSTALAVSESTCASNRLCLCTGASPTGSLTKAYPVDSLPNTSTCYISCQSYGNANGATSMTYAFQCKDSAGNLFVPDSGQGNALAPYVAPQTTPGLASTITTSAADAAAAASSAAQQAYDALPGHNGPVIPILNVPIPGLDLSQTVVKEEGVIHVSLISVYISAAYKYLLIFGSVLAVVMLMLGGLEYVISGGSSKRVEKAKHRITNAVVGLVLLFAAFDLAYLIDPHTTAFSSLTLESIPQMASDVRSEYMLAEAQLAGGSSAPTGSLESFKAMGKPSQTDLEKGVTFFITSYYAPAYGDKQGDLSFECNIAMQCSCPDSPLSGRKNAPQEAKTCYSKGLNYYWEPCTPFPSTTLFCNKTTAFKEGLVKTPPVGHHTAAVSRSVLPLGTVFKVFGAPDAASNSAIWYAEDTGGEIQGRRVDLFMGSGASALAVAKKNIGEVTLRVCPGNDPGKCPTSINE